MQDTITRSEVDDMFRKLREELTGGQFPVAKHARQHKSKGIDRLPDTASLSVRDIDAAPTVTGVSILEFTNGTVSDQGGGTARVTIAAASALTVKEADGSPSDTAVTVIQVPNGGGLTDNGAGDVTLNFEISGVVATHAAAADPHAGYVLESLIDAAGDLFYGSAADAVARLAIGTAAYKLHVASGLPAWTKDYVPLLFIIDGGGATITTGQKGHIYLLENLQCEGWTLLADASGSIVIDVWMDTYANFPPTVADTIAGTEKPTLVTVQKNQDVSLSSFDTTLDAGSALAFNVDSVTTVQRVALILHCYRR